MLKREGSYFSAWLMTQRPKSTRSTVLLLQYHFSLVFLFSISLSFSSSAYDYHFNHKIYFYYNTRWVLKPSFPFPNFSYFPPRHKIIICGTSSWSNPKWPIKLSHFPTKGLSCSTSNIMTTRAFLEMEEGLFLRMGEAFFSNYSGKGPWSPWESINSD